MPAKNLGIKDVQAILRVVGETAELWYDANLQRRYTLESLQPRLRKVMQHLLEGDGEKQVAAKLNLSRHTVHEYVKMLYHQLGVSSRSELLSQWVGRL